MKKSKKLKISIKKTEILYSFISLLLCFSISGCSNQVEQERTEEILGTIVSGKVVTSQGAEPLEKAFERAKELELVFSANDKNSELSKVNETAWKEPVEVSEELFYVVKKGLEYGEKTNGALDITIGKLIDLWGIGTDHAKVPKKKEILPYAGMEGYKKVRLNEEKQTIQFLDSKIQLNLGAIAKGYIADEMKQVLIEEYSIEYGMLSLGGNIVVIGEKKNGDKWKVGIANPLQPQEVAAILELDDMSLVTSGNYERYFEENGVRYHHILDPKTGYPAENGWISTSILSKESIDGDALSTATYILGEEAVDVIEGMENCEAVFIKEDGEQVCTGGVSEYGYVER